MEQQNQNLEMLSQSELRALLRSYSKSDTPEAVAMLTRISQELASRDDPEQPAPKKRHTAWIFAAVLIAAALGCGLWLWLTSGESQQVDNISQLFEESRALGIPDEVLPHYFPTNYQFNEVLRFDLVSDQWEAVVQYKTDSPMSGESSGVILYSVTSLSTPESAQEIGVEMEENYPVEYSYINGTAAALFKNDGMHVATWCDGRYFFYVAGLDSKEESLAVFQSVDYINPNR